MARVSSVLNSLFILWLYAVLRLTSAELRGPPKISEQVNGFRKAVQGRSIKLPCPVTGNPPPLIMWTKDGVTIHSGWERFRVRSEGLKVNDVVIEDSGSYICRATNGFGSVSVNFTLTITDGSSTPERDPSKVDTPTVDDRPDRPTSGTMPQFSELNKMMKTQKIMKPLNSSVRLKCKASGHPRPEIVWEKDGTRMVIAAEGKQSRQFTLKLSHLKSEDSGTYTCIVFNKHGRINATYEVDVVDQVKKKPELLGEHPVNTTVEFGGTTSFQCRVRSDIKPHIQWLKRVETHSVPSNATIEMDGQYFVVLPAGDVLPRPDGSYLNKLIISYATAEDAGMYICLGANTMGYSFKSAFLEVFPDPNLNVIDPALQQTPRVNPVVPQAWSPVQQGLLIGVPVGFAFLFIVVIVICTISRNKARSQRRHRTTPPAPQLPNSSIKKDYNHSDYLNRTNLANPHMMDMEQCAPLTAAQCAPLTSQQTLHIYPVPSRENVLNRYDVHSPSSFTDTLNSNGSLTSSNRPNMHHHLHQHTILHC